MTLINVLKLEDLELEDVYLKVELELELGKFFEKIQEHA